MDNKKREEILRLLEANARYTPKDIAVMLGLGLEETENEILNALDNRWVAGFSLLGGDPFEPEHEAALLHLLKRIRAERPGKTVWAWTGRVYDRVKESPLLDFIDVLVDGPFVEKLKTTKKGEWRGSTNQRVIEIRPLQK